jgi:hypothetical protein
VVTVNARYALGRLHNPENDTTSYRETWQAPRRARGARIRRQSIFLRAKQPISPLQASIASATWQVINAFVACGPQR